MEVYERNGVNVEQIAVVLHESVGEGEHQAVGVRLQDHCFDSPGASGPCFCELGLEVGGAVTPAAMLGQDADDHGGDGIGSRRWAHGGVAYEYAGCIGKGQPIACGSLSDVGG